MTPSAEGDRPRPVLLLLSGPNLALLGERQPEIYGTTTLAEHVARAGEAASRLGCELRHLQSDHESELIEAVHSARGSVEAIVVNAGALSHSSWALHDALAMFAGVVVELHLSNPDAREPWRRVSVLAPVSDGTVAGFGGLGYELAVEAAARLLAERAGKANGA
jgi:3-dehydroquinate dehydratase-2